MAMAGGLGQMVFSMLLNIAIMALFAPKPKDTISYGPRLDNLKPAIKDIQNNVINLAYGTTRVSGSIFWSSPIRETVHTSETEIGGGKGGGSATHTDVTYTYDCDFVVSICEGPIVGIRKIWANKEVIYDVDQVPNRVSWLKFTLYTGTADQPPSPLLQAHLGYDNVSAHRDLAYIEFTNFQLDPFGRRLPQTIEFEVVAKGTISSQIYRYPQLGGAFGDRGNTYNNSQYYQSLLFLDPSNLVVPITNDPYVIHSTLNIPTSSIVRYPLDMYGYKCGISTSTAIYCNSAGQPWGWRYSTDYVWIELPIISSGGLGWRMTPCIILQSDACTTAGIGGGVYIVNAITGKLIATCYVPEIIKAGSFNYFYASGEYNGFTNFIMVTDGFHRNYRKELKYIMHSAPLTQEWDEYGFIKTGQHKACATVDPGKWVRDIVYWNGADLPTFTEDIVLVGFPKNSIIPCPEVDPDAWFVEDYHIEYEYTFTVNGVSFPTSTIGKKIKYENCTYNILDAGEHGIAGYASVTVEKRVIVKKCWDGQIDSDITTTWTTVYPAQLGPPSGTWDADPLPIEFDAYGNIINRHEDIRDTYRVYIHYVSDDSWPKNGFSLTGNTWLKFTDGRELVTCTINTTGSTSYHWLHKSAFSEYNVPVYGSYEDFYEVYRGEYDSLSIYISYLLYTQYTDKLVFRKTSPQELFDTEYNNYNDLPFTVLKTAPPMPSTYEYQPGSNYIYYTSGTNIYTFSLLTYDIIPEKTLTTGAYTLQNVVPYGEDFIGFKADGIYVDLVYIKRNIDPTPAKLGEIIEDISTKARIDLSALDISDKAYNIDVYGYNISDDLKLIDGLVPLLANYFIDAFESEWKIKFRTRKEYLDNTITTISNDELAPRELGENYSQKYNITTKEDTELPESLSYTYIAAENSFATANVIAIRNIDFNLGIKMSVKAPIAMLTNTAYDNAFRILFDVWRANKEYEFRLPRSYAFIEPGDVVLLPINASKYSNEYVAIKIFEVISQSNKFLELKGLEEDARNMEGLVLDGAYEKEISLLKTIAPTYAKIIQSAPLYNKFTNIDYTVPGVYSAIYSDNNFWSGGSLLISYDNGVTYTDTISSLLPSAQVGQIYSVTNISNLSESCNFDTKTSITFDVTSINDFYTTDENDYWYKEGNLVAVINNSTNDLEFIKFKEITPHASIDKRYTITGLTRGLYETFDSSRQISSSSTIILLPAGCKKINIPEDQLGNTISCKMVSPGQYLDSANLMGFTYNLQWYRPYKDFDYKTIVNGSNLVISWKNRERNKPGYPLQAPKLIDALEYKIEIYDADDILKRTVDSVLTTSYTYTSTDLSIDGFTLNSLIKFKVYRKAPVLEYNHDVVNEIVYYGNSNISNIYNDTFNNSSYFVLPFSRQYSTTLTTSNGAINPVYNNANGLGRLKGANSILNHNAAHIKYLDSLSYIDSTLIQDFTIFAMFKINSPLDNVGGVVTNIFSSTNTTVTNSVLPSIKCLGVNSSLYSVEFRLGTSTGHSYLRGINVPSDKTIFCVLSCKGSITTTPTYSYIVDEDGVVYEDYYANTNLGTVGNPWTLNLGREITMFAHNRDTGYKCTAEELSVLNTCVWQDNSNSSNILKNLFLERLKWRQQQY